MAAMSATDEILARMEVTTPEIQQMLCQPFRSHRQQIPVASGVSDKPAGNIPAARGEIPRGVQRRSVRLQADKEEVRLKPDTAYDLHMAGALRRLERYAAPGSATFREACNEVVMER